MDIAGGWTQEHREKVNISFFNVAGMIESRKMK
jgi:hypothetical protein